MRQSLLTHETQAGGNLHLRAVTRAPSQCCPPPGSTLDTAGCASVGFWPHGLYDSSYLCQPANYSGSGCMTENVCPVIGRAEACAKTTKCHEEQGGESCQSEPELTITRGTTQQTSGFSTQCLWFMDIMAPVLPHAPACPVLCGNQSGPGPYYIRGIGQ